MENHPIPQDVTGFKFKLIGSITLKEFLYVLGGGILAIIVFILPPSVSYFIKIPLMTIFSGVGAAFAFVPIEGRPMDKMLYNFIKTVPSENEYIYHKKGVNLSSFEFFKPVVTPHTDVQAQTPSATAKRSQFYSQLKRSYKADQDELAALQQVRSYFDDSSVKPTPTTQPQEEKNPSVAVVRPPHEIEDQRDAAPVFPVQDVPQSLHRTAEKVDTALNESLHPLIQTPPGKDTHPDSAPVIVNQNTTVKLSPEEIARQKMSTGANATSISPSQTLPAQGEEFQFRQQPVAQTAQPAQPLPPQQAKIAAGFPSLPDKPNILLGIVKDPRGKVLQNILVEVIDKNGLSVRAFKTNALGQFASATTLANGNYTVLFNDPQGKHDFSKVTVTLDGSIFQPLEVISIDAREKLRQELFGAK